MRGEVYDALPARFFSQVDMHKGMVLLVLALAAPLAVPLASAQIYRSVMPDGSIVYGDEPIPGARNAREIELPPPNVALPEPVPKPGVAGGAPAKPAASPLEAAYEEFILASATLDAARAALAAGREPLAGETQGTAIPGRARHTDAYAKRIQGLEDAVAAAQKRLDEALARRNALR